VFISDSHCWLSLNEDGTARVGMDDFAKKMIGRIDGLDLPNLGRKFKKGEPLFTIRQGQRSVPFLAPVSGRINKVNKELLKNLEGLNLSTYNKNWVCMMDIDDFDSEIKDLKIGKTALAFFQEEIEDCISHLKDIVDARKREKKIAGGNGIYFGKIDTLTNKEWENTMKRFFG
jgi:glycine cleavage system H lipoate-binding protein